jgi:small subunit ribosomal protein S17
MGKRKTCIGEVVSDKMFKTVVVKVSQLAKHPKYNRIIRRHNKFKAHDEKNAAKVGDIVRIEETRPLSKDKFFRVAEIIKKGEAAHLEVKEEITEHTPKP